MASEMCLDEADCEILQGKKKVISNELESCSLSGIIFDFRVTSVKSTTNFHNRFLWKRAYISHRALLTAPEAL